MKQPHNTEAEEAVLGAMMSAPKAILHAQDAGLIPEHFYRPSHAHVCRAVYALDEQGRQSDTITVGALLKEWGKLDEMGGMPTLNGIVSNTPSISNAGHHAKVVMDVAAERSLQIAAQMIADLAEEPGSAAEKMAAAEQIVAEAAGNATAVDFQRIGAQTLGAFEEVKRAYETGKPRTGLGVGFKRFDELTRGLLPGQLVIVAARPGQGKSTFAQNVAENVAGEGKNVAIFSLEMGADEIGQRMWASLSGVEHDKITTGALSRAEWLKVSEAHQRLDGLPIFTLDGGATVTEIRSRSRHLKRSEGVELLVIDYLQLIQGSGRENRTQEVAEISRSLKLLARELEIPVVCLSQLNRGVEGRTNKRPTLSDLRDSGAIEQDADIVAFIYRDEYYDEESTAKGEAEIILAKQRSGATGKVTLAFQADKCRFREPGERAEKKADVVEQATTDDIPF